NEADDRPSPGPSARSLLRFNDSFAGMGTIDGASLGMSETTASCTPATVQLVGLGASFDASTTWATQPSVDGFSKEFEDWTNAEVEAAHGGLTGRLTSAQKALKKKLNTERKA